MPPGCTAALRYIPLTRYECYGRPYNPVHYFSSELRFSRHGNSLHPQPVAFVAGQQPAFARSCTRSSLQALHTSPKGLRYRCSASLARARQQPASAVGCLQCSKSAFAFSCTLLSMTALHSALKGSVCAAQLSLSNATARIRSQLHLAHPCKRRTPALKGFVSAALLRCSYHGNSLQPQLVALMARQQAASAPGCSRCSKLAFAASCTRSSLQAPHTSPEGLRLRCSASLFVARHQPASAAGCSRCSKPAFASSCISLIPASAALRLEGLRLRSIASLFVVRQQPASAAGCLHGSSLHSHAAAPAHPCKRCTPP